MIGRRSRGLISPTPLESRGCASGLLSSPLCLFFFLPPSSLYSVPVPPTPPTPPTLSTRRRLPITAMARRSISFRSRDRRRQPPIHQRIARALASQVKERYFFLSFLSYPRSPSSLPCSASAAAATWGAIVVSRAAGVGACGLFCFSFGLPPSVSACRRVIVSSCRRVVVSSCRRVGRRRARTSVCLSPGLVSVPRRGTLRPPLDAAASADRCSSY